MTPYYEKTFDRHKRDLVRVADGSASHLRFNEKLGKKYILYIQQLKHHTGVLAGQLIKLEMWQKKVVIISMGWETKSSTGGWVRRFSEVLLFMPRKNGKTLLLSALTIVDSILRGETRGEVVFVGSKRDQAKISWSGAVAMVESHPELAKKHTNTYSTMTLTTNKTTFKTLGRDSGGEDGNSNTIGAFDELHSYPDTKLIDVVKSSMKSRHAPLSIIVTTAGFNNASPLIPMVKYAKDVLEERIEDDSYFAFIAEAPKGADIFDEETWRAANPNYGVSINVDNFRKEAMDAKNKAEELNNFKVKSLNIFVSVTETYFNFEQWKTCKRTEPIDLTKAVRVILGLDLSYVDDMSALVALFEFADGSIHLEANVYIPKEAIFDRERELRAPLIAWTQKGYIKATPNGSIIDLDYIIDDIREYIAKYRISFLAYDPYRAREIVNTLQDESFDNCIAVRQTTLGLSEALIRFNTCIRKNTVTYEENDCFDWHISNTGIVSDSSSNIKPQKVDLKNKIDIVSATVNAFALLTQDLPENKKSVYLERGLRSLL